MEKMRNLVVIVILQLIISIAETHDYQFGDMISFDRPCYNHYAIYVGDKDLGITRDSGTDLFHYSGDDKEKSSARCIFGKLESYAKHEKDNYFDGKEGFTVGSEADMIDRIKAKHKNCPDYKLVTNNCEHLATFVRYGDPHSYQHGKVGEGLCTLVEKCKRPKRSIRASG